MRNVLIAIGNSGGNAGEPKLASTAAALLDDASPLVRAMAVWALAKLEPARLAALADMHVPNETDDAVLAEWRAAISPAR